MNERLCSTLRQSAGLQSARHAARTRYKAMQDHAEWLNRATVYGPDDPEPAVDHIAPISKYEQLADNDIYRGAFPIGTARFARRPRNNEIHGACLWGGL